MIGFQGEVPASVFGGINVPAAPAAFILFPVPRLVLHFAFV